MSQLEHLYALQEIDAQLDRIKSDAVVEEPAAALREAQEKLTRETGKREHLRERISAHQKRMRRMELDLDAVEAEIEGLQEKLFGGEVTNAKELSGLEQRLAANKQRKDQLEEAILSGLDALEEAKGLAEKLDDRLARMRAKVEEKEATLEKERNRWAERRAELESERKTLLDRIDSQLLKRYDSLYDRLGGRPVAKVKDRSCSACHVELPVGSKAPKGDELSRCPNCGRLLWWSEG